MEQIRTMIPRTLLVAAMLFAVSCAADAPTSASSPTLPPVFNPAPLPAPPFPAAPSAIAIYVGPDDLYGALAPRHGSSLPSRYVFNGDSTFVLQFSSLRFGILNYGGRYSRADSVITFHWDGWSTAGPWGATGILRGDALDVRYNLIMMLSDFIDGVYVRER